MLRQDLAAARTAWLREVRRDPDEYVTREQGDFLAAKNYDGEAFDFHALRHTCGAWLAMSGPQRAGRGTLRQAGVGHLGLTEIKHRQSVEVLHIG